MCVINEVAEVSGTQILVSRSRDGSRQFIAYGNKVATQVHNNAMILPVPHPETLKFHDLSKYTDLFSDCARSFEVMTLGGTRSFSANYCVDTLKVIDVGSYQVSVCQKLSDFNRINKDVFQLNPYLVPILSKYYNNNFGFIVCKLREGGGTHEYHPLAYSHKIFKHGGLMFVPARHYHGGGPEEIESDWDHEIYSINTADHNGTAAINDVSIKFKKIDFDFPQVNKFRQIKLKGHKKNTDIYLTDQTHIANHKVWGIDGCEFTFNKDKFAFQSSPEIATLPVLKAKNGDYLFCSNNTFSGPQVYMFYGGKVKLQLNNNSVTILDEPDSNQETEYNFPFSSSFNYGGKNYLTGQPKQMALSVGF